jgi:hypothetical protein
MQQENRIHHATNKQQLHSDRGMVFFRHPCLVVTHRISQSVRSWLVGEFVSRLEDCCATCDTLLEKLVAEARDSSETQRKENVAIESHY